MVGKSTLHKRSYRRSTSRSRSPQKRDWKREKRRSSSDNRTESSPCFDLRLKLKRNASPERSYRSHKKNNRSKSPSMHHFERDNRKSYFAYFGDRRRSKSKEKLNESDYERKEGKKSKKKHHKHKEKKKKKDKSKTKSPLPDVKSPIDPEKIYGEANSSSQVERVEETACSEETDLLLPLKEEKSSDVDSKNVVGNDDLDVVSDADLESISGSEVSLSSVEGDCNERVCTPLDGWRENLSRKRKIDPVAEIRRKSCYQSRSRSRSRTPPISSLHSVWEHKVNEFVRSIGGDSRRSPSQELFCQTLNTAVPPPTGVQYPTYHAQLVRPIDIFGPPLQNSMAVPPPVVPLVSRSPPVLPQPSTSSQESCVAPEDDAKEIVVTPLVKYIGKKLSSRNLAGLESLKNGIFRYNLLSVSTRGEWVAATVLEAFNKSGLDESKLYDASALKGSQGFKKYLSSMIDDKKVDFGTPTRQEQKLIHFVVDKIVNYYSFEPEQEEDDESLDFDMEDVQQNAVGPKAGVGELVRSLKAECSSEISSAVEPANPWSNMWDWMQSENFKTFSDLKNNLAKGFLGAVGTSKYSKNSFETAQDMVSCWVVAGFSLSSLTQKLLSAEDGRILPQPNYTPDQGKFLFHELLDQLKSHRAQLPPHFDDDDLEYLVRKTLIYIARGCDRLPALSSNPIQAKLNKRGVSAPIVNYVFNYLPPGLREMENSVVKSSPKDISQVDQKDEDTSNYVSADPLGRVIDPLAGSHRTGELPNRKYLIGAVHLDWVVINGRAEIFELNVYMSDLTSLDLYIVTDVLQKHKETLEQLNFVANPDRHEFYFVQVGIGCVKAEWKQKAIDRFANFLETKRNASMADNQNNGLVLLFRGEEELSVMLATLQATGHNDLMLDIVKGFACLDNYMEQNKSSKLELSTPKLNVGGCEGFYSTDVRKGLEVSSVISRSKSQALYQAVEIFLGQNLNYNNFVQPYGLPSFSQQTTSILQKLKLTEELYPIEVFIAASLKRDEIVSQNLFLEGVYAPARHRDLRDKCSIVAARFCRALVKSGYDKLSLTRGFRQDPSFHINSSVILDKMNLAQRMSVTDQTMRCLHFLREYFRKTDDQS